MPLKEAEREVLPSQAHDDRLAQPHERESAWGRKLSIVNGTGRGQIARWAALVWYWSAVLAWRLPKYERRSRLMPPDKCASGLAAACASPLFQKHQRWEAWRRSDGREDDGAVFIKVLESPDDPG